MWFSSELPNLNFVYESGVAASFPSVVLTCESVMEAGERRCSDTPLCEVKLAASVITDNGDSFAARDIASRIVKALTGDSDRAVRIPMHGFDYESNPPIVICAVYEMEVTKIAMIDAFDAKRPEMRNVKVEFSLRTRL